MIKHTPGPWEYKGNGEIIAPSVLYEDSMISKSQYGRESFDHYGGELVCESVCCEADARLIAKAPEMLELLRELEWSRWGYYEKSEEYYPTCPICESCELDGHANDCPLAAVLREVDEDDTAARQTDLQGLDPHTM